MQGVVKVKAAAHRFLPNSFSSQCHAAIVNAVELGQIVLLVLSLFVQEDNSPAVHLPLLVCIETSPSLPARSVYMTSASSLPIDLVVRSKSRKDLTFGWLGWSDGKFSR